MIDNPSQLSGSRHHRSAEEPFCNAHIYSPTEYVGNIMELCQKSAAACLRI